VACSMVNFTLMVSSRTATKWRLSKPRQLCGGYKIRQLTHLGVHKHYRHCDFRNLQFQGEEASASPICEILFGDGVTIMTLEKLIN
jgi:hypothetical protein